MASSLATCTRLHSVVFEMPCVHDVVPLLDVNDVVEALTALHSTGSGNLHCPRAAPTQGDGSNCVMQIPAVL